MNGPAVAYRRLFQQHTHTGMRSRKRAIHGSSVVLAISGTMHAQVCDIFGSRFHPPSSHDLYGPPTHTLLAAWHRRGSRVSLISSSVSAFLLLVGFVLSFWFPIIAYAIGVIVACEFLYLRLLHLSLNAI